MLNDDELKFVQDSLKEILKEIITFFGVNNIKYSVAGGTLIGAIRHRDIIPWDDDIDIYVNREDLEKIIKLWNSSKYSIISKYDDSYNTLGTPVKIFNKNIKIKENNSIHEIKNQWNEYGLYVDIFPIDMYPDTLFSQLINKVYGRIRYLKRLNQNGIRRKGWKQLIYLFIGMINVRYLKKIDSFIERNIINRLDANVCAFGYDVTFSNLWIKDFNMFKTIEVNFGELKVSVPDEYERYLNHRFGDYKKLPSIENRVAHIEKIKVIS